jgi:hypothetical protein
MPFANPSACVESASRALLLALGENTAAIFERYAKGICYECVQWVGNINPVNCAMCEIDPERYEGTIADHVNACGATVVRWEKQNRNPWASAQIEWNYPPHHAEWLQLVKEMKEGGDNGDT